MDNAQEYKKDMTFPFMEPTFSLYDLTSSFQPLNILFSIPILETKQSSKEIGTWQNCHCKPGVLLLDAILRLLNL